MKRTSVRKPRTSVRKPRTSVRKPRTSVRKPRRTARKRNTEVISVLLPRSKFTLEKAKKWIRSHNYKVKFGNKKGVFTTDKYYHFKQKNTKPFKRIRTIQRGNIIFRLGIKN